jgi:hypothetical protein
LVKIFPERMSKLKCEIYHESLARPPPYVAISYAQGDGVDTRPLVIGSATVPVALSFWGALRALRKKTEEMLVWIDALCIDQQNRDEQAIRVRLMGHIYNPAKSVAIWLGPMSDQSELAVRLLRRVSEDAVSPEWIRSASTYQGSPALLTLFKREYWKRLWVVQEVSNARKKMVYCGDSVLSWEVYKEASGAIWDNESDPHVRQGPSSFPDMNSL